MAESPSSRPVSAVALFLTAAAGGAVAGVVGGAFIWAVRSLIDLLWHDLPEQIGIQAYSSWWIFAVPAVGGLLVGLGQRFLGNYPEPIDQVVAKWRTGGRVEPSTIPATGINSLSALATGGPVGFEAALTGLLGGIAAWIGERIRGAREVVRQAWGAERIDSLPRTIADLPYWLAAVAGLVAYKALPFGQIDMGFRFGDIPDAANTKYLLWIFVFAALLVLPLAWATKVVGWAETRTWYRPYPEVAAIAGAVVFSTMALGHEYVLFSGQQVYQKLPELTEGWLVYLSLAKWAALVVALLAGWRGGPIFPTITSASAAAVLFASLVDVPADLLMVAAVASVSVVFLKGKVAVGFVLSLYVVPLSNAGLILVGCIGSALAFGVLGAQGWIPAVEDRSAGGDEQFEGA